jgi:uncharacterized protein (TIGR02246 family)
MTKDERAIRAVIDTWLTASKNGDTPTQLGLMTDDVMFLVPGQAPFGKAEFAAMAERMRGVAFEGASDIRELCVLGDWAWLRSHLTVSVTPPSGAPVRRSGPTLSILRKESDGRWRLARDANLLTAEPG